MFGEGGERREELDSAAKLSVWATLPTEGDGLLKLKERDICDPVETGCLRGERGGK